MRKYTLVVFASYIAVSLALECWSCENRSARDCMKYGKKKKCTGGEQGTCQTVVRPENGQRLVTTGCKQENACKNNYNQNTRQAWSPTQCNKGVSSVCRCCCSDDLCNMKMAKDLCEQKVNTPTQAPNQCLAPPEAPINGAIKCSGGSVPGAYCMFTCDKGYQLNGSVVTQCVKNEDRNGYGWDNPTPTCEAEDINLCPTPPDTPENGHKICKGNRKIGSYCDFSCNPGYALRGQPHVTCEVTSSGLNWTPKPPTCEQPVCEPLPSKPINGDVECNGKGELGTRCDFICNTGYYLTGRDQTVCERTLLSPARADWNNPTPICKKVRCKYLPNPPQNGHMECSSDRDLGSNCGFSCFEGYNLEGYSATTCLQDENDRSKADWNRKVPTCKPLPVCDALPKTPTNGDRKCSGRGKIGARCDFNCNEGYVLSGHDHTVCDKTSSAPSGAWNNPTPTCIKVRCKSLPNPPQNGFKKCSSGRDLGSVCGFTCIQGYELAGSSATTCLQDKNDKSKADWDREVPTCEPLPVCDEKPKKPTNGNRKCNGMGERGARCNFTCNKGYVLSGHDHTVCDKTSSAPTGAWNNPTPTCIKVNVPTCEDIGKLTHGEIECIPNNDLYAVGTTCKFQCTTPGYTLIPKDKSEVVCQMNKTWTHKPCCADCSNIKRDVIIALDMSSSNRNQFPKMKKFLYNFVSQFTYGESASEFIIFQFGTNTQAPKNLASFGLPETQTKLLNRVNSMNKMKGVGQYTNTGKALDFAQERFFGTKWHSRPGVRKLLFIVANGKVSSDDRENMYETADELRKAKVEIKALTIGDEEGFKKEMTDVTGSEKNVFFAYSVSELTKAVADDIFIKACEDECKKSEDTALVD